MNCNALNRASMISPAIAAASMTPMLIGLPPVDSSSIMPDGNSIELSYFIKHLRLEIFAGSSLNLS